MHMILFKRISLTFMLSLVLSLFPSSAIAQDQQCFAETNQCISGRFLSYWRENGGLPVFGYPITAASEQISREDGQARLTQWFERTRFEWHPDKAAPYDVLLGRLGEDLLLARGLNWQQEPQASGPQEGCIWFEETQHNVCNIANGLGFKQYWESHGLLDPSMSTYARSLALFGLPLTEAREELSKTDGQVYITQWFERARFEWHPNESDQYKVLLGLLGSETLAATNNPASSPQAEECPVEDNDDQMQSYEWGFVEPLQGANGEYSQIRGSLIDDNSTNTIQVFGRRQDIMENFMNEFKVCTIAKPTTTQAPTNESTQILSADQIRQDIDELLQDENTENLYIVLENTRISTHQVSSYDLYFVIDPSLNSNVVHLFVLTGRSNMSVTAQVQSGSVKGDLLRNTTAITSANLGAGASGLLRDNNAATNNNTYKIKITGGANNSKYMLYGMITCGYATDPSKNNASCQTAN